MSALRPTSNLTIRALRFALGWMTRRVGVDEREIRIPGEGGPLPATLFLPSKAQRRLPGWVVLHGLTRPGRAHPSLRRFARALAGTPAAVLVPEISEWRKLRLSPERSVPIIRSAVLALDRRPEIRKSRIALVGFSFGAPQAVIASAHPSLDGHLHGVVGFGGYADLSRTIRFFFTGEHEWRGERYRSSPDPYGRWIVGANYLTKVPGYEDTGEVARALWRLAARAGEEQVPSLDPRYDELKAKLRDSLSREQKRVFDLFAPPTREEPPEGPEIEALIRALADVVSKASPLLRPEPHLAGVRVPVRLVHGRDDELIPFTETLRLRAAFPEEADVEAHITALFAHSGGSGVGSLIQTVREGVRFLRILRRIMAMA